MTHARVAQRWSTTLPRWGSRVRSPSRARGRVPGRLQRRFGAFLYVMRRTERQKIACRGGSGLFFMRRTERQKIACRGGSGLFFMRRTERQKIACRGGSGLFFMRRTERQKIREVKETGATVCLVVPAFPFLADPRFDFARPGVSCFHDPGEAVCRPRCKRPVRPLTRSLPLSRGYSTSCPHPRPDSGRLPVRCISRGRGRGTDCSGFPHPSDPSPRCWALSSRYTRSF